MYSPSLTYLLILLLFLLKNITTVDPMENTGVRDADSPTVKNAHITFDSSKT